MELNQAIDSAIKIEQQAHDLYIKAKELVEISSSRDLLQSLADEELKHKKALEDMDLTRIGDLNEEQIDSLGFAESLALTPLNELNDLKEILLVAQQREQNEHDSYIKLMELTDDSEIKELFERLSKEEINHKMLLEKEFDSIFS